MALATRLSRLIGLSRRECSKMIATLGVVISDSLGAGESVKFPNFGTLHVRVGFAPVTNPQNKKSTRVNGVRVRAGKNLLKRLRTAASMKQAEANGV